MSEQKTPTKRAGGSNAPRPVNANEAKENYRLLKRRFKFLVYVRTIHVARHECHCRRTSAIKRKYAIFNANCSNCHATRSECRSSTALLITLQLSPRSSHSVREAQRLVRRQRRLGVATGRTQAKEVNNDSARFEAVQRVYLGNHGRRQRVAIVIKTRKRNNSSRRVRRCNRMRQR